MKRGRCGRKQHRSPIYKIRVKGWLDKSWSDWFDGLDITLDNEETLLSGIVVDQSALHGLLKKVRDLGLHLVSVEESKTELKQD